MGSHKNDWNPILGIGQSPLQLDAADARQADIQNETRRFIAIVTVGKKFLCRRKQPWRKTGGLHHASQRFAKRFIIVHNGYDAGLG